MPFIPVKREWTSKPPVGTPLRTDGHWSVRSLVGVWAFNERSAAVVDIKRAEITGYSTGTTIPEGTAFNNTYAYAKSDKCQIQFPFSIVAKVRLDSSLSQSKAIFTNDSHNSTYYTGALLTLENDGRVAAGVGNNGQVNLRICPSDALTVGRWYTIVAVYQGVDNIRIFINGKEITGLTQYGTATSLAYTGGYAEFARWKALDRYAPISVDCVYFSSGALTSEEVASLSANPWQIFEPETVWVSVGSSGTSRSLIANIIGETLTPSFQATIDRALLANIAAQSTTPSIAATITSIISLVAAISGVSTTPSVAASISRSLLANVTWQSSAPSITGALVRAIAASISGESTTSTIAQTISRSLTANISGQSATPDIIAEIAGFIVLAASITGQSVTPSVAVTMARSLVADVQGQFATPTIAATITRSLAASIAGSSVTPDVVCSLSNLITLAANISGVSLTPAVTATIDRALAASVNGSSTVASIAITIERALTANIQAGSLTPNDLVLILAGLGVLSDTTIASLTQRREIISRTICRTITSQTTRRTIHSA